MLSVHQRVSAFLRKKSQPILIPLLIILRFPKLSLYLSPGNSGTSEIFNAPEGSPDSVLWSCKVVKEQIGAMTI